MIMTMKMTTMTMTAADLLEGLAQTLMQMNWSSPVRIAGCPDRLSEQA